MRRASAGVNKIDMSGSSVLMKLYYDKRNLMSIKIITKNEIKLNPLSKRP